MPSEIDGVPQSIPSDPRVVASWIAAIHQEAREPWELKLTGNAATALRMLRARAELRGDGSGEDLVVRRDEVAWADWLVRTFPDLDDDSHRSDLVVLATTYANRAAANVDLTMLNLFLAFTPWRDAAAAYRDAVETKVIDRREVTWIPMPSVGPRPPFLWAVSTSLEVTGRGSARFGVRKSERPSSR
jgi:hypothetical protein